MSNYNCKIRLILSQKCSRSKQLWFFLCHLSISVKPVSSFSTVLESNVAFSASSHMKNGDPHPLKHGALQHATSSLESSLREIAHSLSESSLFMVQHLPVPLPHVIWLPPLFLTVFPPSAPSLSVTADESAGVRHVQCLTRGQPLRAGQDKPTVPFYLTLTSSLHLSILVPFLQTFLHPVPLYLHTSSTLCLLKTVKG